MESVRNKHLYRFLKDLIKLQKKRQDQITIDNEEFLLSSQQRAIVRAMEQELGNLIRAYKRTLMCSGVSVMLYKDIADDPLINELPESIEPLSEASLDKITVEAFVVRKALLKYSRPALASSFSGDNTEPDVQAKPRGNPSKGGLVKALKSKGFSALEANTQAESLQDLGETTSYQLPGLKPELSTEHKKALEALENEAQENDGQNLLDLIS